MRSPIPLAVSSFRGITVSYETSTSGTPLSPSGFTPPPSPLQWATSSGPRASSTHWPGMTCLVSSQVTSCPGHITETCHITESCFFFPESHLSFLYEPKPTKWMVSVCHIKIGRSAILIVTAQALILEPELTLKSMLFTAPQSHCYSIHTAVAVVFKLTVAFCFCPQ